MKKNFKKVLWILLIGIIIFGLWKLFTMPEKPKAQLTEVLKVQEDDWFVGNKDSKVVLVEYLDFECGACKVYHPLVKRMEEEYKDRILFIYRYFPLGFHKNAITSASAVEAAGQQGKYWEMQDKIFEKQDEWNKLKKADGEFFEKYALELGLDMDKFKNDVNKKEVKDRIMKDRDSGFDIGVNGTPTFYLNGEKIDNPRGYDDFKALLDQALTK